MPSPTRLLLALLPCIAWPTLGCADSAAGDDLPPPDEEADPEDVPTEAETLLSWLAAEPYLEWPAESAIHDSTGPHFGSVRTWVNPTLLDSLEQGAAEHPLGSAAVKELYGGSNERRGWAVEVKIAEQSADGDGWYWYEWFDGGLVAQGDGISICTGCHAGGTDFVLTPIPLL